MGQAKLRGTFEERKAAAIERYKKGLAERVKIKRRRPLPKHIALIMGMALSGKNGIRVKG